MLETIYLVRHGFRQSFDSFPQNSPTGTKKDPPLTALGIEQAREVGAYFSDPNKGGKEAPEMIFSSPYYRCLQTATCTADALDLPIHVEFGISEFYQRTIPGTGLHPRPPSASKLRLHFPRVSVTVHDEPLLYASRNGETFSGIHDRADEFIRILLKYMRENFPDVKRVMLVSHAATVIALGRAIVRDRTLAIRAGTCSLSRFDRVKPSSSALESGGGRGNEEDIGTWKCTLNGWTGHLKSGEQRHWDFDGEIEMEEAGQGEGVLQAHEEEEEGDEDIKDEDTKAKL
ncbi:phosphoglycerate mutase-like protein [Cystobasidium minutum MCA 4210]|uniref:phosphoglycerate mutase-like protein n=1 Tax=Cystobasidium minutum MCA 4210 TaxID=1397322 RepID=UPI0034CF1977|eukprot:jgi/Rhomi1/11758/CE11757_181